MSKRTKTDGIREAAASLQTPGVEVSFSGGSGPGATIEDPRRIIEELCGKAADPDPGTEPWPMDRHGEPVEFVTAQNAEEVGGEMIRRILRLDALVGFRIDYLFRFADSWEKNGKTVLGEMKKPSGLLKNYAGADFVVLLNWEFWLKLNPMQRVALVYHELRHGAEHEGKPKIRPHDFEGFFDELTLFGTQTYEDWNALARSVREGDKFTHQFSLGLLD